MGRRVVERERQNGQRPPLTSNRAQSASDVFASPVVPQVHRKLTDHADGPQHVVLVVQALLLKGFECARDQRQRLGVAPSHAGGQTFEQQVDCARRLSPHRCDRRFGGVDDVLGSREAPAAHRCPQGFQVRLPRQLRIECFQASGCSAQQRWSVTAASARERNVSLQPFGSRAVQLVERAPAGCFRHQRFGPRRRARTHLRLRGGDRTLAAPPDVRSQLDGPLQECRGRLGARAILCSGRALLEVDGHGLVGSVCGVRTVPGPAIWVALGVGCVRQRGACPRRRASGVAAR